MNPDNRLTLLGFAITSRRDRGLGWAQAVRAGRRADNSTALAEAADQRADLLHGLVTT